jgi:FkbM family methyltransferase
MIKKNLSFRKIKKILFYFKYKLLKNIRILFKIDQKIKIGSRIMVLPPGHPLSMWASLHKDYDNFLPKLVKRMNSNESIIDIGANVGDTLFRFIDTNSKPNYFSVEADQYFFKYLKKNKELLEKEIQDKVTLINELVGKNLKGNLTQKSNLGTKFLVESPDGLETKSLDEIIIDRNIQNIKLIKVDVDGYDYNVLLSAMNEIKKNKPSLFFEYMSLNKIEYIELIKMLYEIGYSEWTIINNYGSVIFEKKHYKDVLDYINLEKNSKITIDIYCENNLAMNNH